MKITINEKSKVQYSESVIQHSEVAVGKKKTIIYYYY